MLSNIFAFIMSLFSLLFPFVKIETQTVNTVSEEIVASQVASQGIVRIEYVTAKPGDTVKIGVYLDENPGFIGLRLHIGYDADVMTLTEAKDLIEGEISTFGKEYTANPYTLLWVDALSENNYTVTGKVAELTFSVSADAKGGSYPVTVEVDSGSTVDVNLDDVPFTVQNGTLTVEEGKVPVKLVAAEGSTTVIDEERGFIYGLGLLMDENIFKTSFVSVEGDGSLGFDYISAMGTGAVVTLTDNETGEAVAEYMIVIFGDFNGDGNITSTDVTALKSIISGAENIDEASAEFFALDINGDGVISSTDAIALKSAMSGAEILSQNRG